MESTWGFAKQTTPLLFSGPALSLPSMLVIRSYVGLTMTAANVGLVVVMATLSGMAYGALAAAQVNPAGRRR